MKKNNFPLRTIIILALFAALGAMLKAFFSIQIAPAGLKMVDVSLAPLPVMLAGIFFGPLAGFLTGFVVDTGGFFMGTPVGGAYNPLFSVTMGLFGVVAGLFFRKSQEGSAFRVTAATTAAQLAVSVVLNSLIVWLYYGAPLFAILPTRLIGAAVELPVYAWLLMLLIPALRPLVRRGAGRARADAGGG